MEFTIGDFTVDFYKSENEPKYDNIEISIDQMGYYGASARQSFYDEGLDKFLDMCIEYKKHRDENKSKVVVSEKI